MGPKKAKIMKHKLKIHLKVSKFCHILRGKKGPKVINDVGEGLFNVEFGLF